MAPEPRIEVAARVLQIALEVSAAAVGHLQKPRMKIETRAGILAAGLDHQIAIERIGKLVRHAHADSRHEQE